MMGDHDRTLWTGALRAGCFLALWMMVFPLGGQPEGVQGAIGGDTPEAVAETETGETEDAPEAARPGRVLIGKIDGEINLAESAYVKRLIEHAEIESIPNLVLELNTFGGRVDAAIAIRDALFDAPLHTVVFINRRAISAGALISLACHQIAISSGGTIGAATPVQSGGGQEMPAAVEEKYLSYFREEMRATAESRGRNGDIAEAMVDSEAEVEGISKAGKLLTLNTKTAVEHGIVDIEAQSLEEVLESFGLNGETTSIEHSWSEDLVAFLSSQAVTSILMLGMMVFGYLEYQTPGFGFFGAAAITCFLMLYFSHYLVNLAGMEELLLFAIGLVLIAVEVLIVPGFGVFGFAGLFSILGSAVLMLMAGDWSDFTLTNPFSRDAVFQVLFATALGIVSIGLLIRYFPIHQTGRFGRSLVLNASLASASGYESHLQPESSLVGLEGIALTQLRPSGKARIDGRKINVETEGDWIEKGEAVRIIKYGEGRTVVRRS